MTSAKRPLWRQALPPQVFWILLATCCLACPVAYLLLDKPVFDWQIERGFVPFSNLWVDAFRLLGKAWLLVWLLLVWVAATGRWRLPFRTLLALLILAAPLNAVKLLVNRPRPSDKILAMQMSPETSAPSVEFRGLSFPSGDTASAVTVAAALGTAVAWPWATAALVAATGVGVMRVVDLAHHPSDVLAGAAFGIAAALAATRLARRWAPPAIEWWGRKVAILVTVAMPVAIVFTDGTETLLLLLKTYIPLVLAACLARWLYRHAKTAATNRRGK